MCLCGGRIVLLGERKCGGGIGKGHQRHTLLMCRAQDTHTQLCTVVFLNNFLVTASTHVWSSRKLCQRQITLLGFCATITGPKAKALLLLKRGDEEHCVVVKELNPMFTLLRAKHCAVRFVHLYFANLLDV